MSVLDPSLPPVLLFSSSDWNGLWGSRQQVALELNRRGYRVLFIERFAGLEHLYRYPEMRQRRFTSRQLVEQVDGLWRVMPPPLLPGYYYFPLVAQLNANIVGWRLNQAIVRFLRGQRPILWMFKPEHHFMIGRYNELVSVYHCIDEYTVGTSGRKKATIEQLENRMLHKADVVFANSIITWENKKKIAPNAIRFPSGANVAHFGQALTLTSHPQTATLPRPILMYAGSINEKIDLRLLLDLANRRPEWTIVMIGELYLGADLADLVRIRQLPNIHLVGKRPFDELPSWFAAADICLLPYVSGEATRYRSPLKLYEYLATGRPIISTPHPEVDELSHCVSIASPDNWIDRINAILQPDGESQRQERLAEAEKHSWKVRVDGMLNAIQSKIVNQQS